MTTIGIVNEGTLTVYDMNGHGAVELARLRIASADPSAVLAVIEGLAPFLAAQPAPAKRRRKRRYDYAAALDFVRDHPGASTNEVKAHLGIDTPTGSAVINKLRDVGLQGVATGNKREGFRWYHPDQVRKAAK